MTNKEYALLAAKTLDNKKAIDITVIDIMEKASFADYMIIATGNSDRQVNSLVDDVEEELERIEEESFRGAGLQTVTIPSNVSWIGNKAFFGCNSMTWAKIEGSYTSLSNQYPFGFYDDANPKKINGFYMKCPDKSSSYGYANNHGFLKIGDWIAEGDRRKFLLTDGSYALNKWLLIDGKWYYFDKNEYLMARYASPIELVPVAHADTCVRQGPCALYLIATLPPAILPIIIGTKSGDILSTPSSKSTFVWATKVLIPPIPDPMYTPNLSGSMLSLDTSPQEAIASAAAARAYWL